MLKLIYLLDSCLINTGSVSVCDIRMVSSSEMFTLIT